MAKNTVKIDITGDSSNIIQETKKAQSAIRQFGNECKTSSGKVKTITGELRQEKRVVNELSYQYRNMTTAEQKAFGPQINKEIDARISKIRQLKAEQDKLNMRMTGPATGAMTNPLSSMQGAMSQMVAQMGLPIGNIGAMLSSLVNPATAAAAAIAGVGVAVYSIGKAGEEFKSAMNDMKVRLNLSETQVKEYGDAALELGNKFGKSGTEIVKQLQYIAQQAPGMENNKEGMLALAEAANKLAIIMNTSTEAATTSLLEVFSKFNLDAKDTDDILNTLYTACQNSAASLEFLTDVFNKVGTSAYKAGVDFHEVAAAASLLSSVEGEKTGKELEQMFRKLAVAEDKFNPEKVGLVKAIENLNKANLSNVELSKLVGEIGSKGAVRLMEQVDALKKLDTEMRNVDAAEKAFGVKNAELGAAINRVKAAWDNFKIQLADNKLFQQLIQHIGHMVEKVSEFIKFLGRLADSWSDVGEGVNIFEALSFQLNVTVEAIKTLFAIFNKLAHFIVNVLHGAINTVTTTWKKFKESFGDNEFFKPLISAFEKAIRFIKGAINTIISEWNRLRGALGLDPVGSKGLGPDGSGHTTGEEFRNKIPGNKKKPTTNTTTTTEYENKKGGKGGKGGGKGKPQPEIIKGSLEWYDDEIKKINEALKKQNLTEEQIIEKAKELARLEHERKKILDKQEQIKKEQGFSLHYDTKSKIKPEDLKPKDKVTDVILEPKLPDKIEFPNTIFDDLKEKYNRVMNEFNKVQDNYELGLITEEQAREKVAMLQKILDDMGLSVELELDVKESDMRKRLDMAADTIGQLGNAISSIGQATQDETLNAVGIIAGAIATIWQGFAQALASDKSTKSNIWAFIGAAIAGVATMAGVISQINANKFAEGGIVGGSTTIGDNVVAMLNNGEMVLNRNQQSHLFKMLDTGVMDQQNATPSTTTVRIKGEDLYLTLRNFSKIHKNASLI